MLIPFQFASPPLVLGVDDVGDVNQQQEAPAPQSQGRLMWASWFVRLPPLPKYKAPRSLKPIEEDEDEIILEQVPRTYFAPVTVAQIKSDARFVDVPIMKEPQDDEADVRELFEILAVVEAVGVFREIRAV